MNQDINQVIISGRLTSDAHTSESKNFAGFDIAHNMGKNREPLFDSVKMFDKNGESHVDIPFDILKKGRRVKVTGYRRTENETFTAKDGSEHTRKKTYIIATEVQDFPWDGNEPEPDQE